MAIETLTPDVEPKFLETSPAEAINPQDDSGSSSERGRSYQAIGASMMAKI